MKVLVFGAGGMAGHMIAHHLKRCGYEVIPVYSLNSEEEFSIDVSNEKQLEMLFEKTNPDVVVNAVGLLVKACNHDLPKAIQINTIFPQRLVHHYSHRYNFKTILISTDCVFSGKQGLYNENSIKDETNNYGATKSNGEALDPYNLIIRTSIIGPELKKNGIGLLNWFLNQTGTISGFTNAFWNGVTTLELAKFIDYSIQHNIKGLVHIHSKDILSKYDMLCLFKQIYNTDVDIVPTELVEKIDKTIVSTRTDFIYNSKTLNEQLVELKDY